MPDGSENKGGLPVDVIFLMGSPRRGGNTDILTDEALDAAVECGVSARKIAICDLRVSPCLEITRCMKTGVCPIEDDMAWLAEDLLRAGAVVLSSPVFFYGPSAQAKALIDRCQALWARKYVLKTEMGRGGRGYLIAVGATTGKKLFDGMELTTRYFFDALDKTFSGRVLVRGVDAKGAVSSHPEALAEARRLGTEIGRYILEAEGESHA